MSAIPARHGVMAGNGIPTPASDQTGRDAGPRIRRGLMLGDLDGPARVENDPGGHVFGVAFTRIAAIPVNGRATAPARGSFSQNAVERRCIAIEGVSPGPLDIHIPRMGHLNTAGAAAGIEIPLAVIGPGTAQTDGLDTGEPPAPAQFRRDIARVVD